jgi:hypothetical protein
VQKLKTSNSRADPLGSAQNPQQQHNRGAFGPEPRSLRTGVGERTKEEETRKFQAEVVVAGVEEGPEAR